MGPGEGALHHRAKPLPISPHPSHPLGDRGPGDTELLGHVMIELLADRQQPCPIIQGRNDSVIRNALRESCGAQQNRGRIQSHLRALDGCTNRNRPGPLIP
jgi:hypothetical protein